MNILRANGTRVRKDRYRTVGEYPISYMDDAGNVPSNHFQCFIAEDSENSNEKRLSRLVDYLETHWSDAVLRSCDGGSGGQFTAGGCVVVPRLEMRHVVAKHAGQRRQRNRR